MSGKRILVAEDHPGTRGLVVNVLTNILGHKVIVTHDGLSALSLAAKKHLDLIITGVDSGPIHPAAPAGRHMGIGR